MRSDQEVRSASVSGGTDDAPSSPIGALRNADADHISLEDVYSQITECDFINQTWLSHSSDLLLGVV